jgi:hypothetical protein
MEMKMQIDGNMLRTALSKWNLLKESAAGAFNDSLHKFDGEVKDDPKAIVFELEKAELAITRLQVAQMRYNLEVKVSASDGTITLAEAIKRVGYAGRTEKLWRGAAQTKEDPYGRLQLIRDPTQQHAKAVLSKKEAVQLAVAAGKATNELKGAIASGNSIKIEMDLDPALFE